MVFAAYDCDHLPNLTGFSQHEFCQHRRCLITMISILTGGKIWLTMLQCTVFKSGIGIRVVSRLLKWCRYREIQVSALHIRPIQVFGLVINILIITSRMYVLRLQKCILLFLSIILLDPKIKKSKMAWV